MLTFYAQMVYWSKNKSPMWKLICENLACLNEECGEISLSMLASMQNPSQRGVVETTRRQFREVLLRFKTGQKWEENFGHAHRIAVHRDIKSEDVVNYVVEHFRGVFEDMRQNRWSHYNLSKLPGNGGDRAFCESTRINCLNMPPPKAVRNHRRSYWTTSATFWREGRDLWIKELRYQITDIKKLVTVLYFC
jgi:hypothetical protein